jgi:hypothetical protein
VGAASLHPRHPGGRRRFRIRRCDQDIRQGRQGVREGAFELFVRRAFEDKRAQDLLNELALKKSFKPDIIFIDYLNICSSNRYKSNFSVNSYSYVKAIAEELRGLAVEFNVPIVSATQTTRGGFGSSDVELTDTSESFGLPATADLMFALISTEELEGLGQILVKQLKNRYNDPTIHKRFVIGIDRAKMRLYDCEQSAQQDIVDSGQEEEYNYEEKKPKKSFEGFKF